MRVRIGNSSVGGRINIKSKLPSGYQEVEYLESSGTQRIDTGINASSVLGLKYKMRESSGRFGVLGADDYKRHHTYTDNGSLYGFYSLAYGSSSWDSDTEVSVNWLNDRKLYKNGVEVASLWAGTFDTGLTYILFARHNRTQGTYSPYWVGRLYSCKMSVDTDVVRNFIPCIRISDNKPGLYDTVNNEFLVNSGTGEFIVGPNVPKGVLPDEYQRVEYVEGTGTQYIDTGIKFIKGPYKMDFKFYRNDNSGKDMSIFGQRTLGKFVNTYSTYYETVFGTTAAGTLLLNQDVHMVIDSSSGIYQNGIKILNNYSNNDRSSDYSAFMFAFHENVEKAPQWFLKGRIYYYTIWEAGVLTHNFLPCYRKSDGEIGMYDIIAKQFLTNQGTGTFLKGSNINNIICKPHITIEGTTNLFPSQYQNGYYISGDSSSTLTTSGQFSVSCTVQGNYTLSGYYKIASTDSATNPRITLSAVYSDGTTATLKQDWSIIRDGTWRRFSITGTTNESKTLTALKGWLFDYSTSGNARNIACKCVQLENKDHATLYTPTSRPNNTII